MPEAPPSTRRIDGEVGTGPMASTTSRTWKAMASTMARARWARPTPRLSPRWCHGAPGSQWGLPSPVKAAPPPRPHYFHRSGLGLEVGGPSIMPRPPGATARRPRRRRPSPRGRRPRGPARRQAAVGADGDIAVGPEVPGQRGDQAVDGLGTDRAGMHQDEAAGPEGDLGHAAVEARLAEQGGVLVAGHPTDRHSLERRVGTQGCRRIRPNRPQDGRTSGRVGMGTPKSWQSSGDHRRTTMS